MGRSRRVHVSEVDVVLEQATLCWTPAFTPMPAHVDVRPPDGDSINESASIRNAVALVTLERCNTRVTWLLDAVSVPDDLDTAAFAEQLYRSIGVRHPDWMIRIQLGNLDRLTLDRPNPHGNSVDRIS